MHLTIVIVVVWTTLYFFADGHSESEPRCYSRFDYEFKVVEKLFECETAHKKQREINRELKDALDELNTTINALRRELEFLKRSSHRGNMVLCFKMFKGRFLGPL